MSISAHIMCVLISDELEEEEFDEGDEDMLEEEGVEAPDGSVDIWATYDAANEDPVTPLLVRKETPKTMYAN